MFKINSSSLSFLGSTIDNLARGIEAANIKLELGMDLVSSTAKGPFVQQGSKVTADTLAAQAAVDTKVPTGMDLSMNF